MAHGSEQSRRKRYTKFRITGERDMASKAYHLSQEILSKFDLDSPLYSRVLTNLSLTDKGRFEKTGPQKNLEQAINAAQLGLDRMSRTDMARPQALENLHRLLFDKYKLTGDLQPLIRSISIADDLFENVYQDGSIDQFRALMNLVDGRYELFDKTRREEDLVQAFELCSIIVKRIPPWERDLWCRFHDLYGTITAHLFLFKRNWKF